MTESQVSNQERHLPAEMHDAGIEHEADSKKGEREQIEKQIHPDTDTKPAGDVGQRIGEEDEADRAQPDDRAEQRADGIDPIGIDPQPFNDKEKSEASDDQYLKEVHLIILPSSSSPAIFTACIEVCPLASVSAV